MNTTNHYTTVGYHWKQTLQVHEDEGFVINIKDYDYSTSDIRDTLLYLINNLLEWDDGSIIASTGATGAIHTVLHARIQSWDNACSLINWV